MEQIHGRMRRGGQCYSGSEASGKWERVLPSAVEVRGINVGVARTGMKIPPRQVDVLPRKCLEGKGPREGPWETPISAKHVERGVTRAD